MNDGSKGDGQIIPQDGLISEMYLFKSEWAFYILLVEYIARDLSLRVKGWNHDGRVPARFVLFLLYV